MPGSPHRRRVVGGKVGLGPRVVVERGLVAGALALADVALDGLAVLGHVGGKGGPQVFDGLIRGRALHFNTTESDSESD